MYLPSNRCLARAAHVPLFCLDQPKGLRLCPIRARRRSARAHILGSDYTPALTDCRRSAPAYKFRSHPAALLAGVDPEKALGQTIQDLNASAGCRAERAAKIICGLDRDATFKDAVAGLLLVLRQRDAALRRRL